MIHSRVLQAVAVVLLILNTALADVTVVTLPAAASEFAMDPKTGRVAAVFPTQDTLRFYDQLWNDTTPVSEEKVGVKPSSVVFKMLGQQRVFVVLSVGDNRLFFFDAEKRTLLKEARLSANGCRSVHTSLNPDDPYVYYTGSGTHETRLSRFNVKTFEDDGPITLSHHFFNRLMVSADGSLLYTGGSPSELGVLACRVLPRSNPTELQARVTYAAHDQRAVLAVDPHGQMVAAGKGIHSADLRTELAKIDGTAFAFSPFDPTILAVHERGLVSISGNTFRTVKTFNPARPVNPPRPGGTVRPVAFMAPVLPIADMSSFLVSVNELPTVLWEPGRKFVLFCRRDKVLVVPYNELAVDEPRLHVDVAGPTTLTVGEKAEWTLKPTPADISIAVHSAPKSASLNNGKVVWTPGSDDIGTSRIVLKLSYKGFERFQTLTVTVARPFVQLPGAPRKLAVTPDAKTALLCIGVSTRVGPGNERRDFASRLILMDLKSGKTLAERQVPHVIGEISLDDQLAYFSPVGSEAIFALSMKDLSDVKRVFAPGQVFRMRSVSGRLFVSAMQDKQVQLKVPSLEPAGPHEAVGFTSPRSAYHPRLSNAQRFFPVRTADGWMVDGVAYDAEMKTIRNLFREGLFRNISGPTGSDEQVPPSRWGVYLDSQGLKNDNGQLIADRPLRQREPALAILNSQPLLAAATVQRVNAESRGTNEVLLELSFRDLVTTQPVLSMQLSRDVPHPDEKFDAGPHATQQPMIECEDARSILVLLGDRLYPVSLDQEALNKTTPPVQIRPRIQAPLVIDTKPITVEFDIAPAGKTKLTLGKDLPGVSLQGTTLRINPAELRPYAIRSLAEQMSRLRPEELDTYARLVAPDFRRMTGADPKGAAVACSISVVGQDESMQQPGFRMVALMDLSLDEVRQAAPGPLTPQTPERTPGKAPERTPGRTPERVPARVAGNPREPATQPANLEARVQQLEAEMRTLNAKIDLLTQLLRDKQ